MKQYKMTIQPLTPIHVGSGEELDPTGYSLSDQYLFPFSTGQVFARLDAQERQRAQAYLNAGDHVRLRALLAEKATTLVEKREYQPDWFSRLSDALAREITSKLPDPRGSLGISTCMRADNWPLLPGSSIKGAVRTAVLYRLAEQPLCITSGDPRNPREEPRLLGYHDLRQDPFRLLKFSDCTPPGDDGDTHTFQVFHFNMGGNKAFAPLTDLRECLRGSLQDKDAPQLTGTLTISQGLLRNGVSNLGGKLDRLIRPEPLLEDCRNFYLKVLEEDQKYWQKHNQQEVVQVLASVRQQANAGPQAALLRIGWGGGRHSVGLELAKQVRKPGERAPSPRDRDFDASYKYLPGVRKAAEKRYPLGWALLTVGSSA